MDKYVEMLRRHARPMQPIATDVAPRLATLPDIRAVLFDVYGTLLISGSGDVGTVADTAPEAFQQACRAVGLRLPVTGEEGSAALVATIQACHAESRAQGVRCPEVDIGDVWRRTIRRLTSAEAHDADREQQDQGQIDFRSLAIEYETRVNPVWPMPALGPCLDQLSDAQVTLGLVSNAQFFTPLLFPALLRQTLADLGFSSDLCKFSYRYGQAKPGTFLFDQAS
jgi:putative hydrolase of the HAD superfamily